MSTDPRIEHVVVLMLENCAFDFMLGFLKRKNNGIDGLTGTESNPMDCKVPGSPRVTVSDNADYVTDPDGGHGFPDVLEQLFCANTIPSPLPPTGNEGFIRNYTQQAKGDDKIGRKVMECFDPDRLPVLSTLAREFAVCDRWFSSLPGPTWPNRFFAHAASSGGDVNMEYFRPYPMRTIYENLEDANVSWRIYFHDIPQSLALGNLRKFKFASRFRKFGSFPDDAKNGTLDSYVVIEPRYFNFLGRKANDQHPPHDLRLGEDLIADVYEALRKSPLWSKTLLVVTYDEHGGFYDHVRPVPVPNPDGATSAEPPFDFRLSGVRVPAVLVSPFIPRGTVDHTVYDHSSLPATAKKLFNLPAFLNHRDAAANPIDTSAWSNQARTDTPEVLPRAGDGSGGAMPTLSAAEVSDASPDQVSTEPLTELQDSLLTLANSLDQRDQMVALAEATPVNTEHEGAVQVRERVETYLTLLAAGVDVSGGTTEP